MLAARNSTNGILTMNVAYDIEKYRAGNNSAGFTVQLYYSLDGINWTSAGSDFASAWTADAATQGYTTVPAETRRVSATLPVTVKAEQAIYLAWNISVSSGTNCAGAPALAIDNVAISSQLSAIGSQPSADSSRVSAVKYIHNGQVVIRHNGTDYSTLGLPVY